MFAALRSLFAGRKTPVTMLVPVAREEPRRPRFPAFTSTPLERESNDVPTELKTAVFSAGDNIRVEVAYAIFFGNRCVFTWIGKKEGSTINFGEDVAEVIAQEEWRPVWSFRFYDLQTSRKYHSHFPEGTFEFDEIILSGPDGWGEEPPGCSIQDWCLTPCPPEVIALFREHIGENPRQIGSGVYESTF